LTGWVDSDFAADSDTRRSITGYVMALNCAPISWRSCRQGGVTLSSSEAEYVAAIAVAQENAYHGASHLSQVPWREVEVHYSPNRNCHSKLPSHSSWHTHFQLAVPTCLKHPALRQSWSCH